MGERACGVPDRDHVCVTREPRERQVGRTRRMGEPATLAHRTTVVRSVLRPNALHGHDDVSPSTLAVATPTYIGPSASPHCRSQPFQYTPTHFTRHTP